MIMVMVVVMMIPRKYQQPNDVDTENEPSIVCKLLRATRILKLFYTIDIN